MPLGIGFLASNIVRATPGPFTLLLDSKPFVDSGPQNLAIRNINDVTVDTTNNIFNVGCASFNGSAHLEMDPGTRKISWSIKGNFIIHGWARLTSPVANYYTIFDFGRFDEGIMLRPGSGGDDLRILGTSYSLTGVFPANTWMYYAFTREGNTIRFYTASYGSTTATLRVTHPVIDTTVINPSNFAPVIGASRHSGFVEKFLGQMSNFEVKYNISAVDKTTVPFSVL